ncbi:TRAP transporter substrate-binding protein [Aquicoccus porphyridii]|uniref:TRAP transporter substrate-binding protein n=1 Tax=Aquicoccus porphyridii TaxID=1852029 RepID=UPI00273D75A3|nr:TRAP transporter substrate-binding protein [Aquicoccus porphyridii]
MSVTGMTIKTFAAALTVSAIAVTAPAPAYAQNVVKLAHTEGEGDLLLNPYWTFTEVFGRALEAESNGRYNLEVFPNKQLGDLESLADQTARGLVQISAGLSAGHLASYFPDIQILEMPYSFPSTEVGRMVLDGPFGRELSDALAAESGLRVLSYLPSAFRNFSNSVRPIKTPADMEGLKIRVQPIPVHLEIVKALGASATPIAWGELYNALQTGVVDGQENAPYTMLLANLHEVQSYYTLDRHLLNMPMVVINDAYYQSLSAEDQAIFRSAARQASFAMLGIIKAKESQDLQTIAAAGVEIYQPTPAEFQQFVDATREPLRAVLSEKVDAAWFDKLDAAIAEAKAELAAR